MVAACCLQVRNTVIVTEGCSVEAGGQGNPGNNHNVADLSITAARSSVKNTVILQCFDAIGWYCHDNIGRSLPSWDWLNLV